MVYMQLDITFLCLGVIITLGAKRLWWIRLLPLSASSAYMAIGAFLGYSGFCSLIASAMFFGDRGGILDGTAGVTFLAGFVMWAFATVSHSRLPIRPGTVQSFPIFAGF